MKHETFLVRSLVGVFLFLLFGLGESKGGESAVLDESSLPALWKITSRIHVPGAQAEAIGRKLGVSLEWMENTVIQAEDAAFKINIACCRTEDDAAALEKKFVALHANDPVYATRHGRLVAEMANVPVRAMAEKARHILGWGIEETARWKLSFAVAPLTSGPDGGRQTLFNQLAAFRAGGQPAPGLKEAAAPFTFGNVVTLRHLTSTKEPAAFSFQPAPARQQATGDITSFGFNSLPRQADIPVLTIEAIVPVRAFSSSGPAARVDIGALTKATRAWPADDPAFATMAAPLRSLPPLSRMEQALKLTRQKIRFSREGMGTRRGAINALALGRGHCWDFSDIYVTLSRAAGLPTRQVGGWVAEMSGHVWAEVFIEGQGWIAVDPTTTWTGVSIRYVPLWQSEDGVGMNFVWWQIPKLERQ